MVQRGQLLFPPVWEEPFGSLVFLAGPIQGATDWQAEAIKLVQSLKPELHIACPRRGYLDGEFVYEAQVDWETHLLRRAARDGVVLFWLAKEFEHRCDRAFAQTSRFEISEWKLRHERDGVKLAVGIEAGFSNERYIRRRFAQDCPDIQIASSLDAVCQQAVELLTLNP